MEPIDISPAAAGLMAALKATFGDIETVRISSEHWQSLTFRGERHEIDLSLSLEQCERLSGIEDAEFDIPGNIVADIGVTKQEGGAVTLEALTILA